MKIDLSVILNLHDETPFLKRTFASLRQAASYANAQGIKVELVVVLDNAPDTVRNWIATYPFVEYAQFRVLEVSNRSLGLSRNDGIAAASGDYIATADADDLVSYNFLYGMLETASAAGADAIVCAQHTYSFGDTSYWRVYSGSEDISPLALFGGNPFSSRVLAHRTIFERIPYQDSPDAVTAFEDWHFNCEAIANGCRFHIASDTILFYRQRANSIMDRSRDYIMRYSQLFAADLYEKYCSEPYRNMTELPEAGVPHGMPGINDLLSSALICELVDAASQIDPAINLAQISHTPVGYAMTTPVSPGCAYYECVELIQGKTFTDVFVISYAGPSMAGQRLLDVIRRKTAAHPERKILVVLGTSQILDEDLMQQDQITVADLHGISQRWQIADYDMLALRLIQTVGSEAWLHLDTGRLTFGLFRRYSAALKNRSVFYYFRHLFLEQDPLADGDAFNFLSEFSDTLNSIILDNPQTLEFLEARLELRPDHCDLLMPGVIESGE